VFCLPEFNPLTESLPYKHFAVVYGVVCAALEISLAAASLSFVYNALRTVVASAIRLDRIGPIEVSTQGKKFIEISTHPAYHWYGYKQRKMHYRFQIFH